MDEPGEHYLSKMNKTWSCLYKENHCSVKYTELEDSGWWLLRVGRQK